MKTCPKCRGENLPAAKVCRLCATELPASIEPAAPKPAHSDPAPDDGLPVCPVCQSAIEPDWPFCKQCGNRFVKPSAEQANVVSQMRAALPSSQALDDGKVGKSSSKSPVDTGRAKPATIDAGAQQHQSSDANRAVGPKSVRGSGPAETGSQPPGRQSERNLGLTTSVVCGTCGSIQPAGGAFCADCGAQLSPGAIARALAHGKPSGTAALHLITDGGQVGESYRLERAETLIGRAEGDMIFPHDGYMSGRHARIIEREGRYFLIDEGSRNGSFVRIGKEIELEPGDTFLVGKQVLRFDTK